MLMSRSLLVCGIAGLLVSGCAAQAQDQLQQVGSPLNTAAFDLELVYENDFSGDDRIDFETSFVADGQRTRVPDPEVEWVAEGWGGAEICGGRLWVAPVAFEACGERVQIPASEISHMVVWNKNRFPADTMFEFTVNHHGSDNGLTLVFFAADGVEGQGIGQMLLRAAEGEAVAHGAQTITLHVFSSNKRARGFYERSGYDGELMRYIKPIGT